GWRAPSRRARSNYGAGVSAVQVGDLDLDDHPPHTRRSKSESKSPRCSALTPFQAPAPALRSLSDEAFALFCGGGFLSDEERSPRVKDRCSAARAVRPI